MRRKKRKRWSRSGTARKGGKSYNYRSSGKGESKGLNYYESGNDDYYDAWAMTITTMTMVTVNGCMNTGTEAMSET